MEQKKNSPLFYEARDSVESGNYLKVKTKILQKYLAELSIVQPWESDRDCWHAVQRKHEWIQKIETEIQRRKASHWETFHTYKKGIIIGTVGGIVAGIVLFFLFHNDQPKNKTNQLQTPSQHQPISKPVHPTSQTNKDKDRRKQHRDTSHIS